MAYGHRKRSTPEPIPVTTSSYVTYNDPFPTSATSPLPCPQWRQRCRGCTTTMRSNRTSIHLHYWGTGTLFPQPLQNWIGIGVSAACDCGSLDVYQWNRMMWQKENERRRRQEPAIQKRNPRSPATPPQDHEHEHNFVSSAEAWTAMNVVFTRCALSASSSTLHPTSGRLGPPPSSRMFTSLSFVFFLSFFLSTLLMHVRSSSTLFLFINIHT